MKPRIALVEDDALILRNYAEFLRGQHLTVDTYATKQAALEGLSADPPDMVLLDIELDNERDAGFAVCTEIRHRHPQLPIVFLTSHDAELEKIFGLRLGADDYITKDVSLDYLIARIQALFRRRDAYRRSGPAAASSKLLKLGELELDMESSVATWQSRGVTLSLTQFWMLADLCRNLGQVRSHSELMRAGHIVVEPNTIAAHIKAIREAFEEIDPSFQCIRTERGRGYRWLRD